MQPKTGGGAEVAAAGIYSTEASVNNGEAGAGRLLTASAPEREVARSERWAVREVYVRARIAHLRGKNDAAIAGYREVANRGIGVRGLSVIGYCAASYVEQLQRR